MMKKAWKDVNTSKLERNYIDVLDSTSSYSNQYDSKKQKFDFNSTNIWLYIKKDYNEKRLFTKA